MYGAISNVADSSERGVLWLNSVKYTIHHSELLCESIAFIYRDILYVASIYQCPHPIRATRG